MRVAAADRKLLYQGLVLIALAGALLLFSAGSGIDFAVLHGAGANILSGDLEHLYPADLPPPGSTAPFHVYRQSPVTALFLAPLALLPLQVSAFLFGFLKLAGMAGIVLMVMGLLRAPRGDAGKIFLLSLLGVGGYFVEEFRNGNTHLVLLFLIVAAVWMDVRGRSFVAGLPLAVAACVKLTPLIYVPYFLLRRRWLIALATIVFFVALFALPSLLYGAETGDALLQRFIDITLQKTADPHNYSVRGAIFKYLTAIDVEEPKYGKINVLSLSGGAANTLWLVSVGAVALVLAGCTRGPQQRLLSARRGRGQPAPQWALGDNQRTLLEVALWTTALLLASPHTQRLWFTSLFFPFVVMLALIAGRTDDPRRPWIASALGASFLAGTLLPPLMPGRDAALGYEVRSPYLFATIWVFVVLARLLWPVPPDADGAQSSSGARCEP